MPDFHNNVDPGLGFIFPGQGSQALGMMDDLARDFDCVRSRFESASSVLGFDLWQLVSDGPVEALNLTKNTQPALLAASVACWDVWQQCGGPRPALMAGHSFGEYSALVCAGAIDYLDAVALVADRGRYMQGAVPAGEGAMAALLGLDVDTATAVCADAAEGDVCACANLNAPGQIVIAGSAAAVQRGCALARERGAKKAMQLQVSAPAHCELMRPAAGELSARLAGVKLAPVQIDIVHNVDVSISGAADDIRDALVRQMCSPVRWSETIEYFAAHAVTELVECGPGRVLSALVRRIDKTLVSSPIGDKDAVETRIEALKGASV